MYQKLKNILCDCKCKFDGRHAIYFRSGISICVDVNVKIQQNLMYAKKILVES